MTRLYQIKIRKGKSPTKARYEVNKLKQYIKSYGITSPGNRFKTGKDAYLDFDEDGVMNAFDCQPLNPWRQGTEHFYDHKDFSSSFNMGANTDKYKVITKYMTADEYMTLARQATIAPGLDAGKNNEQYANEVLRSEKVNQYAKAFEKGDKFPIPFLIYRGKSKTPVSHEGRHRMYSAAKAFGKKKKFPVYIVRDPSEY